MYNELLYKFIILNVLTIVLGLRLYFIYPNLISQSI